MMQYKLIPVGELPNFNYQTSMAGEFFVLAQLFLRDYTASLTYGHAKSVDILISVKSGKMFKIEVKTARHEVKYGSDKSNFGQNYIWQMNEKHENKKDPNLFYCFVILRGTTQIPRFFIVRSKEVAKYVKKEYKYWISLKRKKKVKNTVRRTFRIGLNEKSHGLKPMENYENKWDILPK